MGGPGVEDAELGERLRGGDEPAFAQLYERHAGRVYDFLARVVRQPAVAEDLTQTTFLRAWERRETLREPARVRSWLFATAHNLAMNHLEQTRPAASVEEAWDLAAPGRGPEGEAVAREASELVWNAAASLEPRQYAVLDMSVRQELTTPEIAGALGVSSEHAAVLVNRAREALANAVRYLLVARRRSHCERLATLVPAGVRSLTREQRSSVDYHMRRCDDCRQTARLVTAPEELFGVIPALPLPPGLRLPPAVGRPGTPGRGPRPRRLRKALNGRGVLAAAGVATVAAVAAVVAITVAGRHHGAVAPPPRALASPAALDLSRLLSSRFVPAMIPSSAADPSARFVDAACPTATTCYAVGRGTAGALVATTRDAARTWTSTAVAGVYELDAVACTSATRCWAGGPTTAAGTAGALVTTSDGRAWHSAVVRAGLIVGSIACPTASDCIVAGGSVRSGVSDVLATTDGGAGWTSRSLPSAAALVWVVRCHDAEHCMAAGTGAWETSDLGASWTDVSPPQPARSPGQLIGVVSFYASDVSYVSSSDVWLVGGTLCGGEGATQCAAFTFHSRDGGATWTPYERALRTFPYAWQIHCQGADCLLIAQAFTTSSVLTTRDGDTWTTTQTIPGQLNALACSSGGFCVAAGRGLSGPDLLVTRQS